MGDTLNHVERRNLKILIKLIFTTRKKIYKMQYCLYPLLMYIHTYSPVSVRVYTYISEKAKGTLILVHKLEVFLMK